jgi:glutathione reductase (NADPH)
MTSYDYDLFVIGGGSGGVRAARIAASHGAKVALAEEYRVGGTCVIRGCVPKKLLLFAARFADAFEDAVGFGWDPGSPRFDWPTLIANKDREIQRQSDAYVRNLDRSGASIFYSRAEILDPHTIRIVGEDRVVTTRYILVATGGHPRLDRTIQGIEHAITSNEIFDLKALPGSLAIAGGGYVAVEFASIMNGLGVKTTLIHRGLEILRGFDNECRNVMHNAMVERGIDIHTGEFFTSIEKRGDKLMAETSARTLEVDQIMFAIGRVPNTLGFGLVEAGVDLDAYGAIVVDEDSRSSVENIFAVGDVTNRLNLTPVAIREGHAVADTLFGDKPRRADHRTVPTAVFGEPELASVGLGEEDAKATLHEVDIYRTFFTPLMHTLSGRKEKTLMKIVVDAKTDRVVGVHIVGPGAAEMVQLAAIAVKMKATKADFDQTVALHPTAAEELVTISKPTERFRKPAEAQAEVGSDP